MSSNDPEASEVASAALSALLGNWLVAEGEAMVVCESRGVGRVELPEKHKIYELARV